jgi:molecular chaperone Hsp33
MHQSTKPEAPQDPPAKPEESLVERYKRLAEERRTGPTQYLDEAPPRSHDTLWRGLTREGEARLLVVRATETAREAARRLQTTGDVAQLLAELMAATLLVRSTLNPEERMQVYINHRGPVGQLLVDAWENGGVRGFVQHPRSDGTEYGFLIGQGTMEVSRTHSRRQKAYRSAVPLQGTTMESFMMHYLLESEQILALLKIEVDVQDGEVVSALGYLLQLMPEGTRDDLRKLTENLEKVGPLAAGMTEEDPDGRQWAETLMAGYHWDQCAREAVNFQCRCSEDRILAMLATLPRKDVEELASGDEHLEMTCDYCATRYELMPSQLQVLLEDPS